MSRWISALNEAAAELPNIRGCFLCDLSFDSGHVRANTSGIDQTFGGNSYTALGGLGEFDQVEESVDFVARGIRMALGGVNSSLISTLRTEVYQGRAATLYVGLFNEQNVFIDTPEVVWSGYMDTMNIQRKGKECELPLTCEHRMRNAPPFSRWSDADQQARSTGDRFFKWIHLVAGYTSSWAGKATTWNYKPGGGYSPG